MIQRQQTLWLLLATVCAILSFQFDFAVGKEAAESNMLRDLHLDAASNLFLLLTTGASVILSFIAIFLFKDRKTQSLLCFFGILLSTGILALYIKKYTSLVDSTLALWSILPVVTLISYFMAFRGIRKDEKLVKSLDKLR